MYEPSVTFDYTTLENVKAHIPEGSATMDALIEELIERVSRLIDRYKRMPDSYYNNGGDYALAQILLFDGNGKDKLYIDHCTAIDQVQIRDDVSSAWQAMTENTDYFTWPYNTEHLSRLDINSVGSYSSWPKGQRTIEVTAYWGGYSVTPPEVEQACIIQAVRWLGRGQQMFRDTGAIIELGKLTYTKELDPDVRATLDSLVGRVSIG